MKTHFAALYMQDSGLHQYINKRQVQISKKDLYLQGKTDQRKTLKSGSLTAVN